MSFLLSEDYLAQARLKEAITCDLFLRADKHAAERRKRATKLDSFRLYDLRNEPATGVAWLVGPELGLSERQSVELAKDLLAQGFAVHFVSRRRPEALGLESSRLTFHHVKPLESYVDHVQTRGRVIAFFLPLCAGLASRGIKSVCLLGKGDMPDCPPDATFVPDFIAGSDFAGRKAFAVGVDEIVRLVSLRTPAMPQTPYLPTVSACVIAKDEEGMIEGCLESLVSIADETIVNDTGSRDSTPGLASEYGARVIQTEWHDNFADARNDTLSLARCSHILMIDADERVVPGTVRSAKLDLLAPNDGWHVQVENNLDGSLTHVRLLRLFTNKPFHRYAGNIHEQVAQSIRGPKVSSPLTLHHLGYSSTIVAVRQKRQRNIDLLLEQAKTGTALSPAYLDFQAATEMMLSGSYQDATALLCKVLDDAPVGAEFRPYAGLTACRGFALLNAVENAYQLAHRLLCEYPGFIEVAEVAAEALMKRGFLKEAEDLLKEGTRVSGDAALPRSEGAESYRLQTLLTKLNLGAGNREEAFAHLVEALKACPGYDVAQILLVSNWPEEAARVLRDVSATSVRPAVIACLSANDRDLAFRVADTASDTGAEGEIHLALKEFGDAARAFGRSQEPWDLCRADILSLCGLAPSNARRGGNAVLQRLLDGAPCSIGDLDQALKILGFFVDLGAMDRFNAGLESLSTHGERKEVLAAQILSERGLFAEAYAHACKVADSPDILPLKADMARRLAKYTDAAAHYALLASARPLTVPECVRYVDCLTKSGQLDLARKEAVAALEAYPDDATIDRLARILNVTRPI